MIIYAPCGQMKAALPKVSPSSTRSSRATAHDGGVRPRGFQPTSRSCESRAMTLDATIEQFGGTCF